MKFLLFLFIIVIRAHWIWESLGTPTLLDNWSKDICYDPVRDQVWSVGYHQGYVMVRNNTGDWRLPAGGAVSGTYLYSCNLDLISRRLWLGGRTTAPFTNFGYIDADTQMYGNVSVGALGGTVYAIEANVDPNIIYLGGSFTERVLRYKHSTKSYSLMTTGCASTVYAMVYLPGEGDLIVGGSFGSCGGVPNTQGVARWNHIGGSWSSLHPTEEFYHGVYALYPVKAPELMLYLGGQFGVSSYDFSNASYYNYPGTFNGDVRGVVRVRGGQVVAAGSFSTPQQKLAVWNVSANAWDKYGELVGNVYNMMWASPYLYIGGSFSEASEMPIRNIARRRQAISTTAPSVAPTKVPTTNPTAAQSTVAPSVAPSVAPTLAAVQQIAGQLSSATLTGSYLAASAVTFVANTQVVGRLDLLSSANTTLLGGTLVITGNLSAGGSLQYVLADRPPAAGLSVTLVSVTDTISGSFADARIYAQPGLLSSCEQLDYSTPTFSSSSDGGGDLSALVTIDASRCSPLQAWHYGVIAAGAAVLIAGAIAIPLCIIKRRKQQAVEVQMAKIANNKANFL